MPLFRLRQALTQSDQARDAVAVLAGGAEELGGDAGALEQEVDVVLPGEADAAEDLERGRGDVAGGVGRSRLRHRRGERERGGLGAGAPGGVVGERARLL